MTKQERNGLELIYEAGDPSRRVVALAAAWGHQEARRLLGVSEPAEEWTDPAAVVLQTSGLWDSLPLRRPLVWLCAGLCAVSLQARTGAEHERVNRALSRIRKWCLNPTNLNFLAVQRMAREQYEAVEEALLEDEAAGLEPLTPGGASWLANRILQLAAFAAGHREGKESGRHEFRQALQVAEREVGLREAQRLALQLLSETEGYICAESGSTDGELRSFEAGAFRQILEGLRNTAAQVRSAVLRGDADPSSLSEFAESLKGSIGALKDYGPFGSSGLLKRECSRLSVELHETLDLVESFCPHASDWKDARESLGDLDAWKGGADQSYDLGHGYDDGFGGGPLV